jgi:hypothetical protein
MAGDIPSRRSGRGLQGEQGKAEGASDMSRDRMTFDPEAGIHVPSHVYVIRLPWGYYNPFSGTQKTRKTASAFWTAAEAEDRACQMGGIVERMPRSQHAGSGK